MLELLTFPDMHAGAHASAALIALAALFGLLIGSFLNVVIHRVPQMMQREAENYVAQQNGVKLPHQHTYNLITPRSACPHCTTPISWWRNIPLLSYLLLRGHCAQCKTTISWHYPAVEITSALLSGIILWHFGLSPIALAALVLVYFLIALSVIDAQTQLLPDSLTLPLLWLGLLVNLQAVLVPLQTAVIGAMAGYLSLWLIYWLYRLITGKEGIGYGDFKLMAALGAWLGWQALPLILLLASVLGALIGLALVVLKRRPTDHPLPFGPYLALAGLCLLLYGQSAPRLLQAGPF